MKHALIRNPAVSVVMPVYNAAPFIREAVESILGQNFSDFEYIVVDDGSTDGTGEILAAYRDPRLSVIRLDHGGVVRAINTALQKVRAPFVARMDGDDISHPDRLGRQYTFLRDHPEISILGSAIHVMEPGGRVISSTCFPTEDHHIRKFMAVRMQMANPATMMRTDCFREQGLHRDVVPEDFDLIARFLVHYRAANLPDPLYTLRLHSSSFTVTHSSERSRYHLQFRRSLLREQGHLGIQHTGAGRSDPSGGGLRRNGTRAHLRWLAMMQIELGYSYLLHGRKEQGRREIVRALRYAPVPRHVLQYLALSFVGPNALPGVRERMEKRLRRGKGAWGTSG